MSAPHKSPDHPVAARLLTLGHLHLVGSRAFSQVLVDGQIGNLWTDASDWDYYLGVDRRQVDGTSFKYTTIDWAVKELEALGFARLPGEAGPYGADQLVEGVFRLPATKAFFVDYPHVDVILGEIHEIDRRAEVWDRIVRLGGRGGRMARGLKAEKAWGAFWWATQPKSSGTS